MAQFYMWKAEEHYTKAYTLRVKRDVPQRVRLNHYRKACQSFMKAFEHDKKVFTLNRIYLASQACLAVEDFAAGRKFQAFEEEYAKTHPVETEYGDVGHFMQLE